MQKFLPILFQLFVLLALGVSSPAADRKDRKAEPLPTPPPQAVQQTAKVRRGEKLTIPLRIYGSQREALKFLIRKEPASGKLTEPEQRGREAAIVVYEPPADLSVKRDQFSYAVQNSAGVSAAADVVITIVDDPPVLLLPDVVKFPPILTGRSNSEEIEIKNGGGGMAEGELKVDPPWQIEGPAEYKLGAGESRKVKLVFAPMSAGPFRSELRFSSDKTRAVGLFGEAFAALSASPASVLLKANSGEVVRTGAFELVNGTEEPQTVTLAGAETLNFPKTVELPASGRAVVAVHTVPDYTGAIAEEIVVKGAGVELRVAVNGAAAGPVLRKIEEQLDFGTVAPGSGATATIDVQNVGGAEGFWQWEIVPPFTPLEQGVKLAAGERKTLMVRLDPGASAGRYRAGLKLMGEQQTVEVIAEALMGPAPSTARSSSTKPRSASTTRTVGVRSSSSRSEEEDDAPFGRGNLPLPSKVQLLEPTRAVVVWPARQYQGSYRLESRSVGLDADRKLKISWSDVPSAKIRAEGKQIVGEIEGLQPGSAHAFRLVNIPPGSSAGSAVGMVQFKTPVQEPLIRFTVLRGLLLLLAVCLGLMGWHRFQRR